MTSSIEAINYWHGKQPKLIGFAGRKSSGKGSAALVLTEEYSFIEMNFAGPLKLGVASMFGWSHQSMYDPELKEVVDPDLGFSRRQAMQSIGTEAVRNCLGKNTWVKLMRTRITCWRPCCIVIADIRMENEAAMVRDMDGLVVHCLRPNSNTEDLHETERGPVIMAEDLVVNNDTDLASYMNNVRSLMQHLGY